MFECEVKGRDTRFNTLWAKMWLIFVFSPLRSDGNLTFIEEWQDERHA